MTRKNKFGFAPIEETPSPRRERNPGPMGTAVRDVAESLTEATEAKVAQRRQNAEDAKAFRAAREEGRVLVRLDLSEISTDDLPRDRLELDEVARSDEMEELKASIKERGQKEPIEVYADADGRYQLKKGWRRFTAISQLHRDTKSDDFSTIVARIEPGQGDRMSRYIDMVEENVVREDLTFAEMAQVAITAANDPGVAEVDAAEMVNTLYAALHKTKRSYIRSFVFLLNTLGEYLPFPKEVGRNMGVDLARSIKSQDQIAELCAALPGATTPEEQNKLLAAFLATEKPRPRGPIKRVAPRQKFEFFVEKTKVTARHGELRIVSDKDFAGIGKERLEEAVRAFEAALRGGPRVR